MDRANRKVYTKVSAAKIRITIKAKLKEYPNPKVNPKPIMKNTHEEMP
ncbi:MAG TPA: hypothetical protein VKZ56_05355 [Membranihabitans sp.]|nr:hypothetical protein [Membranihabitans sp.]